MTAIEFFFKGSLWSKVSNSQIAVGKKEDIDEQEGWEVEEQISSSDYREPSRFGQLLTFVVILYKM